MTKYIVLGTILFSLGAQAALTPTAESLRRIAAIAKSAELHRVLGSAQYVSSITLADNGVYTVVTNKCAVNVRVQPIQQNVMVPDLRVIVDQPVNCLP